MRSALLRALPARIVVSDAEPLLELLRSLKARRYRFTAVTPATHARVLARPFSGRPDLRDIFGWSRPFAPDDLDHDLFALLEAAGVIEASGQVLRSKVRVASLDGELFLHSAYPTVADDTVFFGPDTYRFANFLKSHSDLLGQCDHVVDMGAGSGAGGVLVAKWAGPNRVSLVDSNASALRLAAINAAAADVNVDIVEADTMPKGGAVIANPPYMMDAAHRAYRDGGDLLGGSVALDWVGQALDRLNPGGTMLLYTGAGYVNGEAPLMGAIESACSNAGASLSWHEIDPDVFGEELDEPAYREVERIAAIGAVITTAVANA
jgi:methylase of polypeptide subunit release factors